MTLRKGMDSIRCSTAKLLIAAFAAFLMPSGPAPLVAEGFSVEKGIVYGKVDGFELRLDLARPDNRQGPSPALVYIYGSGWGYWVESRTQCLLHITEAAQRGYVAAAIDYRQTRVKERGKVKYPFPAQLYDAKCAIRWLRANASKYDIDANHIGVAGFSSGGHLALLLGLTTPSDGLEGDCGDLKYSTKVQAVVASGAPTELVSMFNESVDEPGPVVQLLGGNPQQKPSEYASASPLTYVRKDAAPTLLIHGDADINVPVKQASLLDEIMTQVGVPHALLVRGNRPHDDFTRDPQVLDFFDKYLRE